MPPDPPPPLIEFVRRAFGGRFSDLLMAGYGEYDPPERRRFIFAERRGEVEIEWVLEMESDDPPRGEEPLVLAALLKLMLNSRPVAETFYFEMSELMTELEWPDAPAHHDFADVIIEKYLSITFRKYERRRRRRYRAEGARRGRYKLVSGYLVGLGKEPGEPRLTRRFNRVDFDPTFVRGLNEGRVIFAGIDFDFVG